MMPEPDTLESVREARAGSDHAFRVLVDAFYPMVYGIALSSIGNPADAEDIAQDAFVAAWTHLDRLQEPKAFPGWLRTIARNLARTYLRSEEYRRRLRQRVSPGTEDMLEQESAMERLGREEERERILGALQKVSPAAREALVLFYLEQRSVSEAAAALGIAENAMKVRLHDGRRQLRAVYMRHAEDELRDLLALPKDSTHTNRIMAGLAAGPIMASAADAATKSGIGLSLIHSNAMWERVAWGGLAVSKKSLVTILGVILVGFGGLWLFLSMPESERAGTPHAQTEPIHASVAAPFTNESALVPTSALAEPEALLDESETVDTSPEVDAANSQTEMPPMTASSGYARPEIGAIDDPARYASLSGFVIDGRGKPVVGAYVRASVHPELSNTWRPTALFDSVYAARQPARYYEAKSNSDGSYRIDDIAYEGQMRIAAEADGYFCDARDGMANVRVKAGDDLGPINVVIKEGVTFYGRVVSPTGEPVPSAIVRLVRYRSKGGTSTGVLGATITGASGEFQWGFVRDGLASWVVSSMAAGEASFEDIAVSNAKRVDLRMLQPGAVAGTIRHAAGGPASGVEVRLIGYGSELRGNSAPVGSAIAALTDAAGAYRIDSLDPGQSYTAAIFTAEGEPLASPVPIPPVISGSATRWDATIQAPMIVAGHVYGATTAKPVRDIRVTAMHNGAFVEGADVPVDPDGAYEVTLLGDPGEYLIVATPWQMNPEHIDYSLGVTMALSPGDFRQVDLTFPDTFSLSVRVVDSTGNPIEGIVTAVGEDDNVWAPAGTTDIDGRFTWAGYRPGSRAQILVYEDRTEIAATEPIVGEAGIDYPEQIITLSGNGGIEGIAVDGAGDPIANGLVIIEIAQANAGMIQHQAPTDSSGHFVVGAGVPAASIVLSAIAYNETSAGINRHTAPELPVTVPRNQIVDIGPIAFQLQETGIQVDDLDNEEVESP